MRIPARSAAVRLSETHRLARNDGFRSGIGHASDANPSYLLAQFGDIAVVTGARHGIGRASARRDRRTRGASAVVQAAGLVLGPTAEPLRNQEKPQRSRQ
jgi:hypothetical protein